jgi:peptide/nickel transport system substrate-binding protein/oligopeptide transport system substrate-binding protein
VLLVAATLVLAACGGRPDQPDPDGVVRIAIGEPRHLTPTQVHDPDGAQVLSALFTPLVDFDAEGLPREAAADSITRSEGGRVWTITLREGYTFHNGEPVSADDYIDAWNYSAYRPNRQGSNYLFARIEGYDKLNPRGGARPTARTLSGLTKVDELTFTITLSEPFIELKSVLGAPAFYPLPDDAFDAAGALREDFQDAPIGNGPFRMVGTWQRGEPIRVERYPDFAGAAPRIGGVEFAVYQEPAAAYADLLAGTVDVVTDIPTEHLATVATDLEGRYLQSPASGFQFLAFPAHERRLADPDVRRAISMAIDRDQIVAAVFRDAQLPARSFVAPVVPGSRANTCGAACELDPVIAKDLYAQAGGPERLTITYNADGGHRDWLEATCDQLRNNLGVACETTAEPRLADLLTRIRDKEDVGIVRLGWTMDYPSMESYLGPVFSTTGSANFSGYSNIEFDDLIAAGAAAESEEEAIAAYQQAEDILAQDLPVIPLRFGQHNVGHSPEVRNVTVSRLGRVDLTRLEALR